MGDAMDKTCWILLDPKNKEYLKLGDGHWNRILVTDTEFEIKYSLNMLINAIEEHKVLGETKQPQHPIRRFHPIALGLLGWAANRRLLLITNQTLQEKYLDCRRIGELRGSVIWIDDGIEFESLIVNRQESQPVENIKLSAVVLETGTEFEDVMSGKPKC